MCERTKLPSGAALAGAIGSVMLALGAASTANSHNPAGWSWEPMQALGSLIPQRMSTLLTMLGVVVLIAAWWFLRPRADRAMPSTPATLALWSMPLLLVPPVLSADAFAYSELGWLLHTGHDPYLIALGTASGPFAAWVDDLWVGKVLGYYPPGSLLLNWLGIEIAGLDPYWSVVGHRLVALSGVILLAVFLPRAADLLDVSRAWANWFGVLNPLVIVHAVGGAHVDAVAVGLVVVAVWVVARSRRSLVASLLVGPALVGLSLGIKPYAGLALVAVAGIAVQSELARASRWGRLWLLGWRGSVGLVVTLTTLGILCVASGLGFAWIVGTLAPGGILATLAPTLILAEFGALLLKVAGLEYGWVFPLLSGIVRTVAALVLVWLVVSRPHRPLEVTAWGSLVVAAAVPNLLPWYLLLSVALLGLVTLSERTAKWLVFGVAGFTVATALTLPSTLIATALGALAGLDLWLLHRTVGANGPLAPTKERMGVAPPGSTK